MLKLIKNTYKAWRREEDGIAAIEASFIFPVMLLLLIGMFDLGNGILANQKAIRASQVTADLVTRNRTIDTTGVNEAVRAGELALQPYNIASYGVDIVSFRFVEGDVPEIVWRETQGMAPVANALERVEAMAEEGEGVVMVISEYLFEPVFAGFAIDEIQMQEVAFARGRRSSVVERE